MSIKIYNTLGRELQDFEPIESSKGKNQIIEIKMYHCGPTVYWDQHIGNLRSVVWADLIKRSLEWDNEGNSNPKYKVNLVRNFTDVGHLTGDNIGDADTGEDRMDKAASREGLDPDAIAAKYIDRYMQDIELLNADSADHKPRATQYIQEIIDFIQVLLDKDYAYMTDLGVYFDTSKYQDYTKLSLQKLEQQHHDSGHGDVSDEKKRHKADFALWIFKAGTHSKALQSWESPFYSTLIDNGRGFPGWHIECSVMSKHYLGAHFDIHMGGVEHIPVHHTNEIAQSECANGVQYVNYWLHNEHLLVDNKKMSKSEGTSFLLRDIINRLRLEAEYQGLNDKQLASILRYFFLQAHYRSKQNFTWDALLASAVTYKKLLKEINKLGDATSIEIDNRNAINEYIHKFETAIHKDFNIPMALGLMWNMLKDKEISPINKLATINNFNQVFGLTLD